MALSEANEITICQILNVQTWELDYQISWLGDRMTAAVQTAIEDQLDLWDTFAGTTTKIHPTESNRGVETRPGAARSQIAQRIAILLERPDWAGSGNGTRLQRG